MERATGDPVLLHLQEDVPHAFVEVLLQKAEAGYRRAYEQVAGFVSGPQLHDLIGHARRAAIEEALLLAGRTSEGVKVRSRRNKKNTSYYTEARVGRFVFTTVASKEAESGFYRHADYRDQLAQDHQLCLFPELAIVNPSGSKYYVNVVHGPSSVDKTRLGFVRFAFPHPNEQRYLYRYDPYKVFSVDLRSKVDQPVQKDGATPQFKKGIQKKTGQ